MRKYLDLAASALVLALLGLAATSGTASGARVALPPPPAETNAGSHRAVAVLAGGCFWGMEGVFEHVRGVVGVTAGYAGGTAATANYPEVSSETTNHAEAVRIVYDPTMISYGRLLQVYFSVAHDPTEIDGQYPDHGRSYRSAIFAQDPKQESAARAYMAKIAAAHRFSRPLATRIEHGRFYAAEAGHQHFLARHPDHPYIIMFDRPKLAALRAQFPELYLS